MIFIYVIFEMRLFLGEEYWLFANFARIILNPLRHYAIILNPLRYF